MQVKKFEAPTMAEALKLIKTELGPEAIILSTKNHRKGFGLLSKASVEVTAAISEKSLYKKQATEKLLPETSKNAIDRMPAQKQSAIYNQFSSYIEKRRGDQKKKKESNQPVTQKITTQRYAEIMDEDAEATASTSGYGRNGKIQKKESKENRENARVSAPISAAIQTSVSAPAAASVVASAPSTSKPLFGAPANADAQSALQEEIQRLKEMIEELKSDQAMISDTKIPELAQDEVSVEFNNLLRNGVDKRFASALMRQVSFQLSRTDLKSTEKIIDALAIEIMNNIRIEPMLNFKSGYNQRVYALIGPTGVGKTTTIAKLASQAILQKNLKVGLINVDSYKVAALDQLATYAKILNVPFRQATNSTELERALIDFRPLDLVLIDTSGRSQKDSESLNMMRSLFEDTPAVKPILIMSTTTRDQELYDILNRFKIFNPSGLLFSKLDESTTFGCIYNIAQKSGLPLTYFTVGQRVPEDIEIASQERVADLILDL